jgi:hypothetical protein
LDQFEQQLRFAVNLITIIEHARNRFDQYIQDMRPRYIHDESGMKSFATDLELIEGMGCGSVWLHPDNTVRYRCDIVANNTSLELVQSQLDMIISQIVDYLSRDWMISRKRLSGPYDDALLAIHKRWKLEIKGHCSRASEIEIDKARDGLDPTRPHLLFQETLTCAAPVQRSPPPLRASAMPTPCLGPLEGPLPAITPTVPARAVGRWLSGALRRRTPAPTGGSLAPALGPLAPGPAVLPPVGGSFLQEVF